MSNTLGHLDEFHSKINSSFNWWTLLASLNIDAVSVEISNFCLKKI